MYSEMIEKDENSTINNSLIVGDSFTQEKSCNENDLIFIDSDSNYNDSEGLSEELSNSSSDDQNLDVDSNDVTYSVTTGNSPLSLVIKRCNNLATLSEDSGSNNFESAYKSSTTPTFEIQPKDDFRHFAPEHSVELDKCFNTTESDHQVGNESLNNSMAKKPCDVMEYVDTIRSLVEMGLGVSENDEYVSSQVSIDGRKSLVEILLGSQPLKDEETAIEPTDVLKNEENSGVTAGSFPSSKEEELDIVTLLNSKEAITEVADEIETSLIRQPSSDEIEIPAIVSLTFCNEENLTTTNEGSYIVLDGSLLESTESLSQAQTSGLECDTQSTEDLEPHLKTSYLQPNTHKFLHFATSNVQLETSDFQTETSSLHHETYESQLETSNYFAAVDQIIYSPPMFSDGEDDSENNLYYGPRVEKVSPSDLYRRSRTTEGRRLKQLQLSMVGLPPPPSVTNPQLSVDDILRSLKENEASMSWSSVLANKKELQTKHLQQAKECSWPDSASFCYPDIYFNNGLESEQFALLSQKFVQRYVGVETACICNVAGSSGSARKRNKRLGAGFSPGRRLSHLARRRKAFSRDTLFSSNMGSVPKSQPNALAERRQIVVAAKTKLNLNRPVTSKASLNINLTQSAGSRVLSHKRALFQSPDEGKKKTSAKKSLSGSNRKNGLIKTGIQSFKRALFGSASKDKELPDVKRARSDAHPVSGSSKRKLLFDNVEDASRKPSMQVASSSKKNLNATTNHPGSSSTTKTNTKSTTVYNSQQKKKLLWAVAESLRKKGISMSHVLFRPCASSLAKICRSLLPDLRRHSGSTSELMLEIADKYASDIVREKQAEAESL